MSVALFKIVECKVVSIKDYGAFVSISNTKKQGLLHRSQISNHPIDKVEDVMEVGEKIFCKVISTEDGKIGLSMKLVDQTTGRDKDPENLIASRLDGKRKGKSTDSFTPIELGAVLDTVCKRCGVRGHLASSCYAPSGSDSLGLVYSSSEAAVSDEEVSPSLGSINKIKCLVGVVKKIQEDRKNSKKHGHKKEKKKSKVGKHNHEERKRKHRKHRNDEPSCKKKRRSS